MRKISRGFSLFVSLFLFLQIIWGVSAAGYSRYVTAPATPEEKEARLKNFKAVTDDSDQLPISCFAISSNGLIALASNTSDDAIIYVYSTSGEFLYGYRFPNHHCALAVFFEGEDLSIYWGRSGYIGCFDAEGNCIQFYKAVMCDQTSDAYTRDRFRPNQGKIGNIEYSAEFGIGLSPNYTRFVVLDGNGNSHVIFDITREQNIRTVCTYALVAVFLTIVGVIYIAQIKKRK